MATKRNSTNTATKVSATAAAPSKKAAAKKASPKKVATTSEKPVKKVASKAIVETPSAGALPKVITFLLRYGTTYGQQIFITGNHPSLGNGDIPQAPVMTYINEQYWSFTITVEANTSFTYNYILRNNDGSESFDWGSDKHIDTAQYSGNITIVDSWNHAGYFENAFYTEPFQEILLKRKSLTVKQNKPKQITHEFRVKAPLLNEHETICLVGEGTSLQQWNTAQPILLHKKAGEAFYAVSLDLSNAPLPISYKYGVYNVAEKQFVRFEDGNNRIVWEAAAQGKQVIVNDGFAVLPTTQWKGAGVAIPVFSLRSEKSFGVGEFTDMKLLVDWAKSVGLKLVQILPINDTTANKIYTDSYPYSAISAFALHPIYLNVTQVADKANQSIVAAYAEQQQALNSLQQMDYVATIDTKWEIIKRLYPLQKTKTFKSKDYQAFYDQNEHWLVPYAAFCYLRDIYGTSDFNQWPEHAQYNAEAISALSAEGSPAYDAIAIHYFVQYHLHLQLKEATDYAHENGIIVKGDIPIGIYRYGADAWVEPGLYHMNVQAGAPPDSFAIKGQNWGFPTYNWQAMMQDGFAWWRKRFEQMSLYFDAFRIDHILGFFRIWSIPTNAVEGIMGYFVPAIPVHINELYEKGISYNYFRYCKPHITDQVLWDVFGNDSDTVRNEFVTFDGFGNYTLRPEFATQRQVENHFANLTVNEYNNRIKQGLYDLISNVILFEVEGTNAQQFHFRFNMQSTSSYRYLDAHSKQQLEALYVDYFFRRQDEHWQKEALAKLPALKRVTNMLICGEDLGLVPACVPDVMKQNGFLSLEIQRMPKDPKREFFHPNDAPYLSVVTPSTHDMSTIRGWWEEDRSLTQRFYNKELGQWGEAPFFCEAWINRLIVIQHLYSPAMWSIFQLQDLLGIDAGIRVENPNDERINIPADPKHYWRYRMHLSLEQLLASNDFNNDIASLVAQSGRA